MSNSVRVRMAPSPTGDPHVGTAYLSLFNYAFAKQNNGKFILRIEDTDRTRYQEGSEAKIFDSLKWLNLSFDEGPEIGGNFGPYRQSERLDIYKKHAHELVEKDKAYYCFCTPEELEEMRTKQEQAHLSPMYDGRCKKIPKSDAQKRVDNGEKYVIRFNMPDTGETVFTDLVRGEIRIKNELIDDQVLLKSDGYPTYHLGVVVDDHLMKITHVIRAEEWISSVPKHVQIYKAFGWEVPFFAHMPLLRNADKSKISKRKNNTSLLWYKEQGYLPEALLNFFALLGYSLPARYATQSVAGGPNDQEIISLDEFIKIFTFDRVVKSGPIFNTEKLDWINGVYIRSKSDEDLYKLLTNYFPEGSSEDYNKKIIPLIKDRLKKLSDYKELTDFFYTEPTYTPELFVFKDKISEEIKEYLQKTIDLYSTILDWKSATLEEKSRKLAKDLNLKAGDLFMPIRNAVTGKTATPPLFETMEVLGKETCLNRLGKAMSILT